MTSVCHRSAVASGDAFIRRKTGLIPRAVNVSVPATGVLCQSSLHCA